MTSNSTNNDLFASKLSLLVEFNKKAGGMKYCEFIRKMDNSWYMQLMAYVLAFNDFGDSTHFDNNGDRCADYITVFGGAVREVIRNRKGLEYEINDLDICIRSDCDNFDTHSDKLIKFLTEQGYHIKKERDAAYYDFGEGVAVDTYKLSKDGGILKLDIANIWACRRVDFDVNALEIYFNKTKNVLDIRIRTNFIRSVRLDVGTIIQNIYAKQFCPIGYFDLLATVSARDKKEQLTETDQFYFEKFVRRTETMEERGWTVISVSSDSPPSITSD